MVIPLANNDDNSGKANLVNRDSIDSDKQFDEEDFMDYVSNQSRNSDLDNTC